jgi:hypothetical protein
MQALHFLMQADTNYVVELAVSICYWLFGSVLLRGTEVKTPTKCRVVGDFCPKVVAKLGDPWDIAHIHRFIGPCDASTGKPGLIVNPSDASNHCATWVGSCHFLDLQSS